MFAISLYHLYLLTLNLVIYTLVFVIVDHGRDTDWGCASTRYRLHQTLQSMENDYRYFRGKYLAAPVLLGPPVRWVSDYIASLQKYNKRICQLATSQSQSLSEIKRQYKGFLPTRQHLGYAWDCNIRITRLESISLRGRLYIIIRLIVHLQYLSQLASRDQEHLRISDVFIGPWWLIQQRWMTLIRLLVNSIQCPW